MSAEATGEQSRQAPAVGVHCLAFAAASGIQILMYARPLWEGEPVWGKGSPLGSAADYPSMPLVVMFFFGPGYSAQAADTSATRV